MTIAFVKNVATITGGANVTSLTLTVPAAGVALGNVIVLRVFRRTFGGTVSSITDTKGNAYGTAIIRTNTTSPTSEIWAAQITTALVAGNTINITLSNMSTWGAAADEFSGLTITTDQTGAAQGSFTTPSTNPPNVSITPTNSIDLIYAVCAVDNGAGDTYTQDADSAGGDTWHTLTTVASGTSSHAAYKITSSTVTQSYNPTLGSSELWTAQIIGLKSRDFVAAPADSVGITDTLAVRRGLRQAAVDSVGITNSFTSTGFTRGVIDPVGITATLGRQISLTGGLANTAGVTDNSGSIPLTGLRFWLDAAYPSSIKLSGSNIIAWNDRSGNAINFTSTARPGPTVATAALNGLNVVTSDGTQNLAHPTKADTNFLHESQSSVFMIGKGIGGLNAFDSRSGVGATDHGFDFRLAPTFFQVLGTSSNGITVNASVTASGSYQYFSVLLDLTNLTPASRVTMFVNGVNQNAASTSSATPVVGDSDESLCLFGGSLLETVLTGSIAETIIYNRIVTDAERTQIERYLKNKWFGTFGRELAHITSFSETVGITSVSHGKIPFIRTFADTVGIITLFGQARTQNFSDTVGITETTTALSTRQRSLTETVGVIGSATRLLAFQRSFTDITGVTDNFSYARRVALTDTVGITDTLSRALTHVGTITNSVEISGHLSGNIPGTGLQLWLDAAATSTISVTAGFVTTLLDKSPNGLNFLKPTGANGPILTPAAINGLNAIHFDGTQHLENPNTNAFKFLHSGPSTLFFVANIEDFLFFAHFPTLLGNLQAGSPGFALFVGTAFYGGSSNNIEVRINNASGTDVVGAGRRSFTPQWELNTVTVDPANATIANRDDFYVNGVESRIAVNAATATPSANNPAGHTLLGRGFVFDNLYGSVGELIVYDRTLLSQERKQVEDYLRKKWFGIPTHLTFSRPCPETVGITDTLAQHETLARSFNNTVNITDTLTPHTSTSRNATDTQGITATISSHVGHVNFSIDTVGTSATLSRHLALPLTLPDSVEIVAALSTSSSSGGTFINVLAADTVGITGSITSHRTTTSRSFTDTVGITDSSVANVAFTKGFTNAVGIVETITSANTHTSVLADQVGISNTSPGRLIFARTFSNIISAFTWSYLAGYGDNESVTTQFVSGTIIIPHPKLVQPLSVRIINDGTTSITLTINTR